MVEELPQFGNLTIAHNADGRPVHISRSTDELVFLAFDKQIKRLVELHVLGGGAVLDTVAKKSAIERARMAEGIRTQSCMRILDTGEDNGMVYYTSILNDGEFISDYISRRGALSRSTAFALVYQLLDDLMLIKASCPRLLGRVSLNKLLVGMLEDTFLQLRVYDYGLSKADAGDVIDSARLVTELSQALFLLLTGKAFSGENPDRFPSLTQLPLGLRTTLRTSLMDTSNAPASLEKLRDDVREAFSSLTSSSQGRNLRKHLVVIGPLQPVSQLQDILLEKMPVQSILGNRFRVDDVNQIRCYPFSVPAVNAKTNQPVTVHMLPPSRIVEKTSYDAVPLQMWRFNQDRHPNVLRSLSLWESPDWSFLTEEREPGFTLSRLMAERVALNPNEIIVIMKQVRAGLEQAVECGVAQIDLHPSNILLRVGKNGPTAAREHERLMQKRIDAWPPFTVKLRPHFTMRSLYEPLLVESNDMPLAVGAEHLSERDFRHRSFVTLAAYLLAGERHMGGKLQFSEVVPEATAAYVREVAEVSQIAGRAPSPTEFLEKFEATLSGSPSVDLATRLRGESISIEQMESVGAVSDFENEWSSDESTTASSNNAREFRPYSNRREGLPWIVYAAAAVITLSFGAWWLLDHSEPQQAAVGSVSSQTEGPKVDLAKPVGAHGIADSKKVVATPSGNPKPIIASQPMPEKPMQIADTPLVKPTEPSTTPSLNDKPSTTPPQPTETQKQAEKEPVIIRKAILPTAEEIERMKQGLVKRHVGSLPITNTASELPRPPL